MDNIYSETAKLISDVLNGETSSGNALERFPKDLENYDSLIGDAWHLLHHFTVDSDIRARDKEYDEYKRKELNQIKNKLLKVVCCSETGPRK